MFNYLKKLGLWSSSFFLFLFSHSGSSAVFEGSKSSSFVLSQKNSLDSASSLKVQLSSVLSVMALAHSYLKEKDLDKFNSQIRDMISKLRQIKVFQEPSLNYHQKIYLSRQINRVKENLHSVLISKGQKRTLSLKNIYRELVSMSQVYSLEEYLPQYSVYFCSQDDSTWIQDSSVKKYNPFKEGRSNCGKKIR